MIVILPCTSGAREGKKGGSRQKNKKKSFATFEIKRAERERIQTSEWLQLVRRNVANIFFPRMTQTNCSFLRRMLEKSRFCLNVCLLFFVVEILPILGQAVVVNVDPSNNVSGLQQIIASFANQSQSFVVVLGSGRFTNDASTPDCNLLISNISVEIRGQGKDNTIIDCGYRSRFAIVVGGGDTKLVLQDLTIRNGAAILNANDAASSSIAATIAASPSIVSSNFLDWYGGCIFIGGSRNVLVQIASSSRIEGCKAIKGGGIAVFGASLQVEGTEFIRNVIDSRFDTSSQQLIQGGGIFSNSNAAVKINQCIFLENQGFQGRSDDDTNYADGVATSLWSSELLMTNIIIRRNSYRMVGNSLTNGPILRVGQCNGATLANITFEHNIADYDQQTATNGEIGGAFYVRDSSSVLMENITLINTTVTSPGLNVGAMVIRNVKQQSKLLNITISDTFVVGATVTGSAIRFRVVSDTSVDGLRVFNTSTVFSKSLNGVALLNGCSGMNMSNIHFAHNVAQRSSPDSNNSSSSISTFIASVPDKDVVSVINPSGMFWDGPGKYPLNKQLFWLFRLSDQVDRSMFRYHFNFTFMEIEYIADCSFDSFSLYDGPSPTSPLIGRWCGGSTASGNAEMHCGEGQCPPFDAIYSSGSTVLAVFVSDTSVAFEGLNATWNLAPQSPSTQLSSDDIVLSASPRTLSPTQGGYGGGLCLTESSNLLISNLLVKDSAISDPLFAAGGGVFITAQSSNIVFRKSISITNNKVSSLICGGGGFAVIGGSFVVFDGNIKISNNSASSTQDCYSSDGKWFCGGSWGGGGLVSGDGSQVTLIERRNTTPSSSSSIIISNNIVECGVDQDNCFARGGGIAVAEAGSVEINGCELSKNRANQGGAIGVFGSKTKLVMSSTLCRNNSVAKSSKQAIQVRGGCLFGTDDSAMTINSLWTTNGSIIECNIVNGNGNGGGISIEGELNLAVKEGTIIRYNEAADGGGIRAGELSIATCQGCLFYGNKASFVGGAIRVDERATLILDSSNIHSNIAPQATAIWGSGENNHFDLSNSIILEEPGNIVNLVGSRVEQNVAWNCTAENSIMESERTEQRLTHSCVVCGEGTYSIGIASSLRPEKKSCFACPVGGICGGGSAINNETSTATDIRSESIGCLSQPGYWGLLRTNDNNTIDSSDDIIDGSVTFYLCPRGYCCPTTRVDGCDYDFCRGNRTGRLCGQCEDGLGQRLLTDGCFDNSGCNDLVWFVPVVSIGLFFLAMILVRMWGGRGSEGIEMVALFFYQMLPTVKPTPWIYALPGLISFIQSIVRIAPTGTTDGTGICVTKDLGTKGKMGASFLFQAGSFGMLMILFCVHHAVFFLVTGRNGNYRKRRHGHSHHQHHGESDSAHMLTTTTAATAVNLGHNGEVSWILRKLRSVPPPHLPRYISAATALLTLLYAALVMTSLELVQCVEIDGVNVWWHDAAVECYQIWQIGPFVFLAVLIPLPMLMMWKTYHWGHAKHLHGWQGAADSVLVDSLRKEKRWWLGISLYRRLLLVAVSISITNASWLLFAQCGLLVQFLIFHLISKPYKSHRVNWAESMSLIVLVFLALLAAPERSIAEDIARNSQAKTNAAMLEWAQLILAITPGIVCGLVIIDSIRRKMRKKRSSTEVVDRDRDEHDDAERDDMLTELKPLTKDEAVKNRHVAWHPSDIESAMLLRGEKITTESLMANTNDGNESSFDGQFPVVIRFAGGEERDSSAIMC